MYFALYSLAFILFYDIIILVKKTKVRIILYCEEYERKDGFSMENLRLRNQWRKSILLLMFAVLAMWFSPTVQAADEATIYGVGSDDAKKITSIPADYPQSYQISAGVGGTYRVTKGDSAKVSASGQVTPRYTYWKRNSNFSISVSEGEPYDYYTLNEGDTNIEVKTASGTYTVTVHVKNYTDVYCDKVIEDYIANNITAAMSDRQKLEAIARFPASYDYSPYYSGVNSMILNGGGDCWASTSAIIAICKKLNINAWARNGNKDVGAGSGHMNAMVELNGVYYELEAGYYMEKGEDGYRSYDVSVRDSLFCYYTIDSNSLSVYQYDGQDTSGELVIPASINGKTVVEISDRAFMNMDFTKVILPDTLTAIGDYAFSTCSNLQSIAIPAAVKTIGIAPFPNCNKLTDLTVAKQNEYYTVEGGVIYSKDKTTMVTCPNASSVTIPKTVTKIADYAFYYNPNLKKISIPESVVSLGVGAFGNCSSLKRVYLSTSVKSLGAYAFAYCYGLDAVCFYGDAPEFGSSIDGTYYDRVFYSCTTSAYYPEGNATWTKEIMTGHDGSVTWELWPATVITSLNQAAVTLEQTVYAYTGSDITPTVTVTLGNVKLRESVDYTVSYENNQKAGTATVTVTGIGGYDGTVYTTFTIVGGETETGTEESEGTETEEIGTEKPMQYYDKKTGMTLSITGSSKNVTLISVNSKKVKSSMVIPDTIKVDGRTYTITAIGKNAFKNNTKLTKIKLGSKVKTIEASAFYGCKKLKSVTLGKNVTKIGDKAFYKCKALTKITIGAKVSKIGKQAFYNCGQLKSITIKTTKLTSGKVGSNAFKGIHSKAVIKVPKTKLKAYRTLLKKKGIGKKVTVKK